MAIDPLAAALALRSTRFPPGSRYNTVGVGTLTGGDGRTVAYLQRRFLPDPARLHLLPAHTVTDPGERLDNLAARFLGDPLQHWRICDANLVMQPSDLVRLGAVVRITLPEGLAGAGGA